MKGHGLFWLAAALCLLTACAGGKKAPEDGGMDKTFFQISQSEAAERMALDDGHVVVDVRREDEYAAGHIPGAVCIPNESIGTEQPTELPDLEQVILVYCRTGRRSKEAAQKLCDIGYTKVYEFGGIVDWTGEIVTGETDPAEAVRPAPVLVIEANGRRFYAVLADNAAAEALAEKLSAGALTLELHDYGGFEKVGALPWELTRSDASITTEPGDVILYQGDQISVYYDENTWSFTRLAKIGGVTREELLEALGGGSVTVTFWVEWSE